MNYKLFASDRNFDLEYLLDICKMRSSEGKVGWKQRKVFVLL